MTARKPFVPEIVVIGASLGGLAVLTQVLQQLPATFRCPIVIAQHRRADADSRLVELLQRGVALAVVEPDDKQPIAEQHVYLAPPDYHVLIERGHICLSVDAPVSYSRPSIDVLFESAADAYGAGALGVVMTGASDDGAIGAAAIKSHGGRLIVQDPKTAESPVAPLATLARVRPDDILAVGRIAKRLIQLCA